MCAHSNIAEESVPTDIASGLLTMKETSASCEARPGLSQSLALGGDLQGRHTCNIGMLETSTLKLYELQVLCFTRNLRNLSAPS